MENKQDVTIYTTPTCTYCKQVKKFPNEMVGLRRPEGARARSDKTAA